VAFGVERRHQPGLTKAREAGSVSDVGQVRQPQQQATNPRNQSGI
jgi:hypothetical protein